MSEINVSEDIAKTNKENYEDQNVFSNYQYFISIV
jgi:hypothetical protein